MTLVDVPAVRRISGLDLIAMFLPMRPHDGWLSSEIVAHYLAGGR